MVTSFALNEQRKLSEVRYETLTLKSLCAISDNTLHREELPVQAERSSCGFDRIFPSVCRTSQSNSAALMRLADDAKATKIVSESVCVSINHK